MISPTNTNENGHDLSEQKSHVCPQLPRNGDEHHESIINAMKLRLLCPLGRVHPVRHHGRFDLRADRNTSRPKTTAKMIPMLLDEFHSDLPY